jgi:hypothetical protein
MKMRILILILPFFILQIHSQIIEVTSLGTLANKAYARPGIFPGLHDFQGGKIYGYETEFGAEGNVLGKKPYSVNINDIALTKGFLEFDKLSGSKRTEGFKYIDYETGTSKYVDIFKITKTESQKYISILRQHIAMEYFVAYNGEKFFLINENLEIAKEYKAKYSYPSDNLFEVFSDGCVYSLTEDKDILTLRKIDIKNEKEFELKISAAGLEFITPNSYNYSFLDVDEYRFEVSKDGSRSFLGCFPGKEMYDQNRGMYVNKSTTAKFVVIDNVNFTVLLDKQFDIPDEFLTEATEGKPLTSPNLEDIEFKGEEIIVSTSGMTTYGVNPLAIYRIKLQQKTVELDGMIMNKFDEGLARSRHSSQIFSVNGNTFLFYFTHMTDDTKYKSINKTYPTLHVVNITNKNYQHKIFKDELAALDNSYFETYDYSVLNDRTILLLAATGGMSYENLRAVKISFE